MAHVTMSVIEDRTWLGEISRRLSRWGRLLALAPILLPSAVLAADVYYPEYKRDPVPPVAVVEDLVVEDDGAQPVCNPANDDCEDPGSPETLPSAVAVAD